MTELLISWIDQKDIDASQGKDEGRPGPISRLLGAREFDKVLLLYSKSGFQADILPAYRDWLGKQTDQDIEYQYLPEVKIVEMESIYEAVEPIVKKVKDDHQDGINLTYYLSTGTRYMTAIWVLLGNSIHLGKFVQSSIQEGVKDVDIPFDLDIDYLPERQRKIDEEINRRASGELETNPAFKNIIAQSKIMKEAVKLAEKVADRSVTVLLEGNPGTGKEMFAKAIHEASDRKEYIKVDCGSPTEDMFTEEFFARAAGATLYLARLNELPDKMQVQLLDQFPRSSARLIVGTDIQLRDQIKAGKFRQELYYLLAAAMIKLPDIKKRGTDLALLVDHFFEELNTGNGETTVTESKKLLQAARRALLEHRWPGNVTELINTLQRVILWTDTETIKEEDMKNAILEPVSKDVKETILDRDLETGIDLQALIREVQKHYLVRGWKESGHNKKRLAKMLGLPNYQTVSNWLDRHGIA